MGSDEQRMSKRKRPACSASSPEEETQIGTDRRFLSYGWQAIKLELMQEFRMEVVKTFRQSANEMMKEAFRNSWEENKLMMEECVEKWKQVMEESMGKFAQMFEHATSQPTILAQRATAGYTERNDVGNLQLQFDTGLPDCVFSGRKLEGKKGGPINIHLINKDTGEVVHSGPVASIKLDVVVIGGDFAKDDNCDWTQEEFEKYQLKEREGKAPLVIGDLHIVLKNGCAQLGELTLTDNSSWYRSKTFRIGVKVAPGCNEGIRIREAITEAFRVKDHRGEVNMKHNNPKPDDEVWRLKTIAKDGQLHKKLITKDINVVQDILRHLIKDSNKLRQILGISKSDKKWQTLVDHAKSCVSGGKYFSYDDVRTKKTVVFNDTFQLEGAMTDGSCSSVDSLPEDEKVYFNSLVKKACEDWKNVREYNPEFLPGSMRSTNSSTFPADVSMGQKQWSDSPIDQLASAVHAASPGAGCNGNMPFAHLISSENANINGLCCNQQLHPLNQGDLSLHESSTAPPPPSAPWIYSPSGEGCSSNAGGGYGIRLESTAFSGLYQNQLSGTLTQAAVPVDWSLTDPIQQPSLPASHSPPSAQGEDWIKYFAFSPGHNFGIASDAVNLDDGSGSWPEGFEDIPTPTCRGISGGVTRGASTQSIVAWLKIKAAMRWGFFVRRKAAERRAMLVELD